MNWAGKRVLVTGAGGFIGSHLVERLVELGAETRAFVHYNALGTHGWLDRSTFHDDVTIVAGDICDRDTLTDAMNGVDVVFHLAALIAIPYSHIAAASYVHTNIEGTLNVLTCARAAGVGRLVHTSTSEVYGTAQYVPIDELHPIHSQSPYAASKAGADHLVEAFRISFNLPVVVVRPFNTFGPRQSTRAVVPTIIAQCLLGETVRLGNIHPTRDLNFVSNTVDGFISAASTDSAVGRTINLGSGKEISIGELAHVIARVVGRRISIEVEQSRLRPEGSEVDRLIADNTLAGDLLGWQPRVGLEEGLWRTVEWMRSNGEHFRATVYQL